MLTSLIQNSSLFWSVSIVVSLLYGVRGVLWQRYYENIPEGMKSWHKLFLHSGHDFVYNVVCSLAGFFALRLEANIIRSIPNIADIGVGTAGFLGFLTIVAILGMSGVLPRFFWKGALIGKKD